MPAAHDSLLQARTAKPKVRLAVLSGSEARGKADAASDLDVGVAPGRTPTSCLRSS